MTDDKRSSLPGEDRLALLQERLPAFYVVLAGETARHEVRQARKVALALGLHGLDGDLLERGDGERRICGDSLRVLLHEGGKLRVRQHAVDEAHGKSLVGCHLAGAEE